MIEYGYMIVGMIWRGMIAPDMIEYDYMIILYTL